MTRTRQIMEATVNKNYVKLREEFNEMMKFKCREALEEKKASFVENFFKAEEQEEDTEEDLEEESEPLDEMARKVSSEAARAFANRKKYSNKATKVFDDNGTHKMTLHGNLIARHHPDGHVEVSHAGWNSTTTRDRTSELANHFGKPKFRTKQGQLYHGDKEIDSDEWVTLKDGAPKHTVKW